LAEGADLVFRSGFLGAKLVAWKAEHLEAAEFIGAIEPFEAGVLRGVAAFAGGIHKEQDLPTEIGEADLATVKEWGGEFINRIFNHGKTSVQKGCHVRPIYV